MVFNPGKLKNDFYHVLLIIVIVLTLITGFIIHKLAEQILFYALMFIMVTVIAYIYYLIYAVSCITYSIDENGIKITYGLKRILIPWDEITRIERKNSIKWIKASGNPFPGKYTHYNHQTGKYESIAAYATDQENLIVISTAQSRCLINPEDTGAFLRETLKYRYGHKRPIRSENKNMKLWETKKGQLLLLANIIALLVLTAIIYMSVNNSNQPIIVDYNLSESIGTYRCPHDIYILLLGPVIVLPLILYLSCHMHNAGVKNAESFLWIPLGICICMGMAALIFT